MTPENRKDALPTNPESATSGVSICLIRNWNGTPEALETHPQAASLIAQMDFTPQAVAELLTRPFPEDLSTKTLRNDQGQITHETIVDSVTHNGQPLDRLLEKAFPAAASSNLTEMTQFQTGGEIIWIIDGAAELTYATQVAGDAIPQASLQTVRVQTGDVVISTTTPNNWTAIERITSEEGTFSFVYLVGNPPTSPHRYNDIPKRTIPIQ